FDHLAPRRHRRLEFEVGAREVIRTGLAHIGGLEFLEGDLRAPWFAAQAAIEDREHRDAIDEPEMLVARAIRLHQQREALEPLDRWERDRLARRSFYLLHQMVPHSISRGRVHRSRRGKPARSQRCRYSSIEI